MKGNLKVFCIGADWFLQEMQAQEIDVKKVEWTPAPEQPSDIANILSKLVGAK